MTSLDHIMFAAADLEAGVTEIADLTGVRPSAGGRHLGIGTRNALIALGESQYLEIIAPDPEQELEGSLGEKLIEHGGSGVRGWAVAAKNLTRVKRVAADQGLRPQSIFDVSRTTPEGVDLDWQILAIATDRRLPFSIDWKESLHPAHSAPAGCSLASFVVSTKYHEKIRACMSALEVIVDVRDGEEALIAKLDSPFGVVELASW